MIEGDEPYVDLGGGENTPDPNAPLMAMLHRMQRKMAQLKSHNDMISLASEEQDRLISELNSRSSQEVEGSRRKMKGRVNFSEDSEEDDATRQQSRQKKELEGEFWKIKPPPYDEEKEEDVEAWLLNMIKYFQVYKYECKLRDRLAIYQL